MVPLLLLLLGCRSTPAVDPPAPERWFAVQIGEVTVGAVWTARSGEEAWRGQRFRWRLDGQEVESDALVRATVLASGQVSELTTWRGGDRRSWVGEAWWLDLAAVEETLPVGQVQAVDPGTHALEEVETRREADTWLWTRGGVTTELSLDGPRWAWGGVRMHPVAGEPELTPVDPVALLRRPSRRISDARRRHRLRWRVGEETLWVEAPLASELPAATRALLDELVAEVRGRLTHAPTPGSPSALAALQSGKGDCNEFAAVFVALAETRGLRARPVSGVVYTDQGAHGPGLDLHAWAEVDLGGRLGWTAVDPALGQSIADATHLKLGQDGDVAAAIPVLTSAAPIEILEAPGD